MAGRLTFKTALVGIGLFLVAFVVLGSVSVVGWEFSNSNWFCSNACHQVHPEEPVAQQLSAHANINCVDCHIGRLSFFPAAIKKSSHVKLDIYNIQGQLVRTLLNGIQAAERHSVEWDGTDDRGRNVKSGTYFIRLIAGSQIHSRKMVLLR